MTDNGSAIVPKPSPKLQAARPRPPPKTSYKNLQAEENGKAERFIQTSLAEWAYARAYNKVRRTDAEMDR